MISYTRVNMASGRDILAKVK